MENFLIFPLIWIIFPVYSHCATVHNARHIRAIDDQYIEVRPNGTLILRSVLENPSNALQELTLFKTILNAINMVPSGVGNSLNDISLKIYGEGVEHKFPPFLENIIQRIQTYFSVYRYTDSSDPLRDKYKPTVTYNDSESNEIDVNLSSDNKTTKPIVTNAPSLGTKPITTKNPSGSTKPISWPTTSKNPSASAKPITSKKPSATSKPTLASKKPNKSTTRLSSTSTTPSSVSQSSEENEFIEIEK